MFSLTFFCAIFLTSFEDAIIVVFDLRKEFKYLKQSEMLNVDEQR